MPVVPYPRASPSISPTRVCSAPCARHPVRATRARSPVDPEDANRVHSGQLRDKHDGERRKVGNMERG